MAHRLVLFDSERADAGRLAPGLPVGKSMLRTI